MMARAMEAGMPEVVRAHRHEAKVLPRMVIRHARISMRPEIMVAAAARWSKSAS
jgi:hypothetical protein